jgi:hypothetical protein
MAKASLPVEVMDDNVIPHIDGDRVNEVEPRSKDAPWMMRCLFLGPSILWIWELVSWGYRTTLERRPCLPTGGKWWEVWS